MLIRPRPTFLAAGRRIYIPEICPDVGTGEYDRTERQARLKLRPSLSLPALKLRPSLRPCCDGFAATVLHTVSRRIYCALPSAMATKNFYRRSEQSDGQLTAVLELSLSRVALVKVSQNIWYGYAGMTTSNGDGRA